MTDSDVPGIFSWGVVAKISAETTYRMENGSRRAGTRRFVVGAKVWVLPGRWGDGGERVYAVGNDSTCRGRKLSRTIIPSDRLVNFRSAPVYSPTVLHVMTRKWTAADLSSYDRDRGRINPGLYLDRESAESVVQHTKQSRTRAVHLTPTDRPVPHNSDEDCEFCDGRDAFLAGASRLDNPHAAGPEHEVGTWGGQHGMWAAGWQSEAMIAGHCMESSAVGAIAKRRRIQRDAAAAVGSTIIGETVRDVQIRAGEFRENAVHVRLVRDGYEPRRLDGVVHAWIDDSEVIVRTQHG